jgi:Alpha-galactosidases/6-phospho-beta-glucosidases, family 4 of glycosyl hydrolases
MEIKKLKIAIIGAGSVSFCPVTVADILRNESIHETDLEIALMDIDEKALEVSSEFCLRLKERYMPSAKILATLNLREAVTDADFVVTAIEKERYFYWSQDFHLPRKYGFRQIYGENGGPGGMFHTLRNLAPMLEIAHTMEEVCPNAWLLNYTNPEAKLVGMITQATKIKAVGLCHGEGLGVDQAAEILEMDKEDLETEVAGLNHFGVLTKIKNKHTGEDLYPLLKEKELQMEKLAHWDERMLSRIMLRLYGVWIYPGTNHIGEYIAWGDEYLASAKMQYFYDPMTENPWSDIKNKPLEFMYSIDGHNWETDMFKSEKKDVFEEAFSLENELPLNHEYGVPIIEAIHFNKPLRVGAVNMMNDRYVPNLPNTMVVEVPAIVDGNGIHPQKTEKIPTAVAAMIATQGTIAELIYEAYTEKSRNKLLQAIMLDPTVSTYNNAVNLINEICELQKDILPELNWQC